ncbi:MAG: pilus assembly PilX N-terminal domain-containing protein [bacterium]
MQNNTATKTKNKQGQVLLIAVMLLATVITVVMTIAFNSTTETQVARLEADSQKALAAAEAGVDAVIKQSVNSSVQIGDLGNIGQGQFKSQGITGNAQVTTVSKSTFVTPLLQKDEQYTFYLSDYPGFGSPWSGSFLINLVSESGQCPSLEVVVVKNTYEQDRYAYNTCAPTIINNATSATENIPATVIDSVSFQYKTSSPIVVSNGIVAFVKVLRGRTKLGFQGMDPAVAFPIQGKTVESEARTESGVVKRVELFQSFPQIPSNFFMTSF